MSTDLKLSKAQINKIIQSGGFLSRLLGPLLKTRLPLIKNVIKPLAKGVLIPLGLTAAASAADVGIHKIKNEIKEQKGGFLSMLLGTLGASLLGKLLTGKGIERAGSGNNKEKGIERAGSGKQLLS